MINDHNKMLKKHLYGSLHIPYRAHLYFHTIFTGPETRLVWHLLIFLSETHAKGSVFSLHMCRAPEFGLDFTGQFLTSPLKLCCDLLNETVLIADYNLCFHVEWAKIGSGISKSSPLTPIWSSVMINWQCYCSVFKSDVQVRKIIKENCSFFVYTAKPNHWPLIKAAPQ